MLKHRLITAAILGPLSLWAIIALSTQTLSLILALIVIMAAWEWSALIGLKALSWRVAYLVLVLAAILGTAQIAHHPQVVWFLLTGTLVWWIAALVWVSRFNKQGAADTRDAAGPDPRWSLGLVGLVLFVPTWLSLVLIHGSGTYGPALLVLLLLLVWGADAGAYFSGRRWGKTRLAVNVSPGKTWEGVYGGVATAIMIALIATSLTGFGPATQAKLVMLCLISVLFSIVGDLFESMVKRRVGVKDSGQLLPGHGGVLDRIDSLLAAAPIFCLGLLLHRVIL